MHTYRETRDITATTGCIGMTKIGSHREMRHVRVITGYVGMAETSTCRHTRGEIRQVTATNRQVCWHGRDVFAKQLL